MLLLIGVFGFTVLTGIIISTQSGAMSQTLQTGLYQPWRKAKLEAL